MNIKTTKLVNPVVYGGKPFIHKPSCPSNTYYGGTDPYPSEIAGSTNLPIGIDNYKIIAKQEQIENSEVLKFKYVDGVKYIYPAHPIVDNWRFNEGEEDKAALCNYTAKIAEKNNMAPEELIDLFPAILRILKDNSRWSE